MKRSGFKRKNNKEKKPSKNLFPHLARESKADEDRRIKTDYLDPYFHKHGLYYTCELALPMCIGSVLPLQYAHSKKRGEIALKEPERTTEMCEVVRACTKCHYHIEHLPEKGGVSGREQMYQIVRNTIEKREKRINRWKLVS